MVWNGEEEVHWRYMANCYGTDPNVFFPPPGVSNKEAKDICKGCAVRAECLQENLYNQHGIYGGKSERERRRMKRLLTLSGNPPPSPYPKEDPFQVDDDLELSSELAEVAEERQDGGGDGGPISEGEGIEFPVEDAFVPEPGSYEADDWYG